MKSSTFVIAVLATVALLGCEEATLTDPPATTQDQHNLMQKPDVQTAKPAPRPEIIQFTTTVKDPTRGSGPFIAIQGQVAYRMLQKERPGNNFELRLQVDAELTPTDKDVTSWRVYHQSIDLVSVSEEGVAWLNKVYRVGGAKDGLLLGLRFQITQYSVEVAKIWLEKTAIGDSDSRY